MDRIARGEAYCALCGTAIRPGEDALITPDFIADSADPLWRVSDAPILRACFLVWDHRKAFIARYNALARQLVAADGSYPQLTSEGELVRRLGGASPPAEPSA